MQPLLHGKTVAVFWKYPLLKVFWNIRKIYRKMQPTLCNIIYLLLDKITLCIPLSTQSYTDFLPKLLLCRAISLWYGSSIYKSLLLQNKVYFFDALNSSFRDFVIIFDFLPRLEKNLSHFFHDSLDFILIQKARK